MNNVKRYRISLKDKMLHRQFMTLKLPGDFHNQDEILKYLLNQDKKAQELEMMNTQLKERLSRYELI